ncbi:MAG: FliH/SctL family protein [Gammaproteobacteria bacterium]|nr:flagellar assembly protein FliH [Gammaproteobacteria bacterium]
MSDKVIPADQARVVAWRVPDVDAHGQTVVRTHGGRGSALPTVDGLERLQKQAYDEAFQRGHSEGLAAGSQETESRAARLEALMVALAQPFRELDEQVEQELVRLALAIARQLVRREIKTDPGQVVAVVREALAALPVASRNARLHLHPEDAKLVREVLSLSDGERPWQVVEDPVLTRGGCRVITDTSQIDASLESRLAAMVANVLGGDRESDRESAGRG